MLAKKYRDIIESFLLEKISADEFQTVYFRVYKEEKEWMGHELFRILDGLFVDIDAYSPLWEIDDEKHHRILERTLRQRVADALVRIDQYLKSHLE